MGTLKIEAEHISPEALSELQKIFDFAWPDTNGLPMLILMETRICAENLPQQFLSFEPMNTSVCNRTKTHRE